MLFIFIEIRAYQNEYFWMSKKFKFDESSIQKKSFKEIYFCNNNLKKNEQYEFKKSFYVIEFFFRVLKNDCNKILHYTR